MLKTICFILTLLFPLLTGCLTNNQTNTMPEADYPIVNADKEKCEATKGNVWKPQGKAQIPACISTYSDAGKPCESSSDCQGKCMVTSAESSAVCASSSSRFGCGSSIEEFKKHGGILCID